MRIVFSEDPQDFHARDWSALVDADPAGTFFHTPDYLKLYWEEFGETPEHLLLAFAEDDDGAQVGAVAFERIGTTLRFLGGTEVTDYMGPVALPDGAGGHGEGALGRSAAARRLDRRRPARARGGSRLARAARATAARRTGVTVEETEDQNGVAPFLRAARRRGTSTSRGLPAKLRHEIKRKARKLEAETGPFAIVTATQDTLIPFLDRFVELHRMSEGPKGVFMQPGMEIFFRRLGEAFGPRGIFRLTFIEVDGVKAAGTIGFRFGGHVLPLQLRVRSRAAAARARDGARRRGHPARRSRTAATAFDLLKGDYAYKYRFGAHPARGPAVDRHAARRARYRRSRGRSRRPP